MRLCHTTSCTHLPSAVPSQLPPSSEPPPITAVSHMPPPTPSTSTATSSQSTSATPKAAAPETTTRVLCLWLFAESLPPAPVDKDDRFLLSKSEIQELLSGQSCRECGAETQLITKTDCFDATLNTVCPDCGETRNSKPRFLLTVCQGI